MNLVPETIVLSWGWDFFVAAGQRIGAYWRQVSLYIVSRIINIFSLRKDELSYDTKIESRYRRRNGHGWPAVY